MEVNGRPAQISITLITKGCCFICLKAESIQDIKETDKGELKNLFSFRDVLRHLQITDQTLNGIAPSRLLAKSGEIQAELCQSCRKTMARFSFLLQQLEKIQMETNYCMQKINRSIQNSKDHPDSLQNYSKKMTSDSEALSQLAFADSLRKEIAKKTSSMWTNFRCARVCLTRIKAKRINNKVIKNESDNSDEFIEVENNENNERGGDNAPSPTSMYNPESSPSSPTNNCPCSSAPESSGSTSPPPSPPVVSSKKGGSHKKIKKGIHYKKSGNNQFNCTFCNKTFLSLMGTRFHIRTNHFGKRYKCHKCKDDFALNDTLKKHLKWCQGVKRNRGTPTGFEFGKHVTKNYKTGEYNCASCSKVFNKLDKARSHYTVDHLKRRFTCTKCNGEFKSRSHLRRCKGKVKVEPKPERKLTCDKCNAHYKSKAGYYYHVKRCKSNQLKQARQGTVSALNPESGMYKCSLCPKEFGTREKCRHHYDKIHLKRKFKCHNCNVAIFKYQKSLWHHIETCKKHTSKKRIDRLAVKTEEKSDDVAALVEVTHEDPTT